MTTSSAPDQHAAPAPAGEDPLIPVGVLGARGRMGTEVVRAVNAAEDLELVAMVDEGDWLFDVANAGAQVVVDFTRPDVVMDNIRFCIDHDIHCVVGTTGFDEAKLATVAEWLAPKPDVGVVIAPNFGIGAVLLMRFAQEAARFFPSTEVVELHHPDKVDAPSGTALLFGQAAAEGRGIDLKAHAIYAREGHTGARPAGAIGFQSLRGGSVVGEHVVVLAGEGERVELAHRAESRAIFVRGALKAALWARGRKPGLYSMADVLGLAD